MRTALCNVLLAAGLLANAPCSLVRAATSVPGQIFVVTHTGDDGPGSLREAIHRANAQPGMDSIAFRIEQGTPDPTTRAFTIPGRRPGEPAAVIPLPEITSPLSIDGYTQPGAAPASADRPPRLLIEITGTGLRFNRDTSGSIVRGLVINRAPNHGVFMRGASNLIEGNFIGTDVTGTQPRGNTELGVLLDPSHGNVVRDNLVSANLAGIVLNEHGQPLGNDVVSRNKIGTDVTGTQPLGNRRVGLFIWTHHNLIEDNRIAFNGTDGDRAHGIVIDNSFRNARFNTIRSNWISGNTGHGIEVRAGSRGNTFSGNRIFDNRGLGIDLGRDGLTLNDPADSDEGENDWQNYPVLDPKRSDFKDETAVIAGSLDSHPESDYVIELFANDPGDARCVSLPKPMLWLEADAQVRNVALGRTISSESYTMAQARTDTAQPGALPTFDGAASSLVFHLGQGGDLLFQPNSHLRSLFPIGAAEPGKPADNFITSVHGRFVVHPDANQNGVQGETILVTWGLFADDEAEWVVKGGPFFLPDPDSFDPSLRSVYREHDGIGARTDATSIYKLMRLQEGAGYAFELHHSEAQGRQGLTLAFSIGDERDNPSVLAPLASRGKADFFRHHSAVCGAQSFNAAQGRQFLSSFRVRTDSRGQAVFQNPLARSIRKDSTITATATRWVDGKLESTSEFSEGMAAR